MKLSNSFWLWEAIPLWIFCGFTVLIAVLNPDYLAILFHPTGQSGLNLIILGFSVVGSLSLLMAVMLLSNLRSLWPETREEARASFVTTWLVCPFLLITALVLTTFGTLVLIMTPACVTMTKQLTLEKARENDAAANPSP